MGEGDNFKILWGDTAVMRGDIELMGGPPSPPTRENPDVGGGLFRRMADKPDKNPFRKIQS